MIWLWWVRLVKHVEQLNHPYWHTYDNEPGTHWGPLSERVCAFADWITRYYAHD